MRTTSSLRSGARWVAMATEIKLPRLGQGMEAGTIVKWLKSEGDAVEKGEPLYELDTDKVTREVEAYASGVLLKIAVREGEVPVGQTVAVIGRQGEEVLSDAGSDQPGPTPPATEQADDTPEQTPERPAEAPEREPERERGREAFHEQVADARSAGRNGEGGRIKASPLARRIARERGIELGALRGTGPEGRVVAEDVERAAAGVATAAPTAAPSATEVERQPLTSVRRTIARRLTEAWTIPVFQISMSADM